MPQEELNLNEVCELTISGPSANTPMWIASHGRRTQRS